MPWTYCQSSGDLYLNNMWVARGYSGHGDCRNVPAKQDILGMGPIPRGWWNIAGPPEDTDLHGPFVLRLEPRPTTNTFGRSGFLVHGDSSFHPGGASLGCICLPPEIRKLIWASDDRQLEVIEDILGLEMETPPLGTEISK